MRLSHADPARVQEFSEAFSQGMVCQHFIPQPEDVIVQVESMGLNIRLGWQMKHWGGWWDIGSETESDAHAFLNNGKIYVMFDTAVWPPLLLYQTLHGLGYCIQATYLEPATLVWGTWEDGQETKHQEEEPSDVPESLLGVLGVEGIFDDDETEDAT
jgi:hypothetical protein